MACKSGVGGAPSAISAADFGGICGGCKVNPPMVRTFLADKIPVASRAQLGQEVTVELGGIPLIDSMGRFAHVLGFHFQGTYRVTGDAANTAVAGKDLLAVWGNIHLSDLSGWVYAHGINGRDIRDDQYFRNWMVQTFNTPNGYAANLAAATHDRSVGLSWQLVRTDGRNGGDYAGAIPLAALAARVGALRFTPADISSAIGANPGFASVQGFQTEILVFAKIAYLPAVAIPLPWQLETYTISDLSGAMRHADRMTEYLSLRHYVGDAAGEGLAGEYGAITVSVNGDVVIPSLTVEEIRVRDAFMVGSDLLAGSMGLAKMGSADAAGAEDAAFNNLWHLPQFLGTDPFAALLLPQSRAPEAMPSGQIGWMTASRPNFTFSRFSHRTVACHYQQRAAEVLMATGCRSKVGYVGLAPSGRYCDPSDKGTIVAMPLATKGPF